ncbi:MAG: 3-deoxy-manno-octulosonate cytidylyltransferase [Leptospirillia bacterium]
MAGTTEPRVVIVLPARYASSRLPGKPLADLLGKPLIQHAYEAAARVPGVDRVLVATDDQRIADGVKQFGGQVVVTTGDHRTGTDRLTEVAGQVEGDLFVNIQGDEILKEPAMLAPLIATFKKDPSLQVGTLCHAITDVSDLDNPNVVKVTLDHDGFALYFSRASIPYRRDAGDQTMLKPATFFRHFGIYIYRREALMAFPALPDSSLEDIEKLEQLRFLQAGYRIRVLITEHTAYRVDTPFDLEQVARDMSIHGTERRD